MKIGRGFLFFLLLLLTAARAVFCYDNLIIHPRLSTKAIEVYNQDSDNKITQEESVWIIHGSIAEDNDPRYVNHFYNPKTGLGLYYGWQHLTAKEWANNQMSASGDYDINTIMDNYRSGNTKRAWQGVGHILHLIQDMSVPAHVRDDEHGDGDPLEKWLEINGGLPDIEYQKYKVSDINSVFDSLANFTYNNFFSKDTILCNSEMGCDSFRQEKNYLGEIVNYCIINEYKKTAINVNLSGAECFLDEKVHQDYWNILTPQAIGYSAGVIEWFKDEFDKIDSEQSQLSLLEKFKFFLASKIVGFSQGFAYVYGDMYLPGQVLREDELKGTIEKFNSSEFAQNSAKAVVKLDEILDSASSGTKKALEGAIEQIKVLGEEFVYTESEASAETITAPNVNIADSVSETVKLERVIDGDTIVLQNGDRVRYIGIDAPELNQAGPDDDECLAWVAKVRNEQLLKSGEIKLIKDENVDKDKYGRLLRYVYVGDNFINASLVREGLAEIFFCQPGWENCPVTSDKTREEIIRTANELAQDNQRGIYSKACLAEEKIAVTEKIQEAEKTDEIKPENFIVFHSSAASSEEDNKNLDNQNSSNQDTNLAVSFFNLYDLKTLNQEYTASTTVGINLEITNEDLAETFCLSENENYPGFTDPCWRGGIGETYELSSGDGLKKIYLFIRQGDEIITSYTTIYLDTESLQIYFVETPAIYASSTEAVFVLGANKEVVGEYVLDKESPVFSNVGEEILFTDLSEEYHDFYFQGLSLGGEIASTSFSWLIDLSAPTVNLEVSQIDNDFNLSWAGEDLSSASSSGSGIDFYNVFYRQASSSPWEVILEKTQATSTDFTLASSSEEISFGVEAVDRAGNVSEICLASSSQEILENKDHIVISEVQFASDVSSKDEFVELYNPTEEEINLFAYRLSRKTKSGAETNLLTEFPEVILSVGGYYLITHEEYDGLNPSDSIYSTSQSIADDNTIILYSDAGETVLDKLGVGEASDFEGEVFVDNPQKGFSLERKALASSTLESIFEDRENFGNAYDSDNNSSDFIMQSEPNPRGLNLAPEPKLLSDNLEYLWHFDECIGYEAFDMIQSGLIEDDFGWSEGVWGCASSLSKAGRSTEINISLSPENGISLGFFAKAGIGLSSVSLFDEEINKEIKLGVLSNNLVFWDGANYQFLSYNTDDNWHYYTLILEEKSVKIFVDGVFLSELNLEFEFSNFDKLKLGEAGFVNFDELAIWSRVLSVEEILEIFNRSEPLEPVMNYNQEKRLYEWKSSEATSTLMTELIQGDDLEIGEAKWYHDEVSQKYLLNLATSSPLEKELSIPITQENFSINFLFGHTAMGKNIDNSLIFSSSSGNFGFRLYDRSIDVYVNGETYTFDCIYSAGFLSLVFDSESNKFFVYANSRLLGEGDYIYQNHEITSYKISAQEDNYVFYSLSIWDGILTTNQIRGQMMNL